MILLVLGVVLWSSVHLFPCVAVATRRQWIARIGEQPYKGLFSLLLVTALVLMVLGWRSAAPIPVYQPPAWGRLAVNVLMFPALILFAASAIPSNLKRVVRHPQLSSVALWGLAHLLANGDRRSLVLFGGLALWAVLAIAFINRRDGAWVKPAPLPGTAALRPVVAAIVAWIALFLVHPYIAGVSPMPG